ncbi:sulfite exporter TauE/SafE family protein [Polluticoccus soli]|uniref:sulfite exporter TauE/SafE family protein n=1 Tax=Polluticoccus soli TaxID=3034150 RepID=UPI0023E25778|nr:sulfite exporter TauE/SafE family protein [Flavipsychrobacter sp. JY13-12]
MLSDEIRSMEILGYLAATLIGISLGLIGGGGSILTVPVLVYLFGIDVTLSTSYSLFIIGTTSLVGAYRNYRKGQVSIRTALLFGISSIATVYISRKFLLPVVPDVLFNIGDFHVTRSFATMTLFAALMLFASLSMIKSNDSPAEPSKSHHGARFLSNLLFAGIGVGLVTGLLGAGGGFLLIPVLVLLFRMPMKEAVGTSLLIIALNSLFGFAGDMGNVTPDWKLLLTLTAIAISGILAGGMLSNRIDGKRLKKSFGWFVLIMAVYILIKETLLR